MENFYSPSFLRYHSPTHSYSEIKYDSMLIYEEDSLTLPKVVHTKTYRQMIGLYIRKLREERGYLLRQMAALLDVDPTILSKMEREERPFKKENIIKVAEVCNLDNEELLIMWLADKICDVVKDEDVALKAIKVAKNQVNRTNGKLDK